MIALCKYLRSIKIINTRQPAMFNIYMDCFFLSLSMTYNNQYVILRGGHLVSTNLLQDIFSTINNKDLV